MNKIIYFASDDTIGDTTPEDCEAYREWASEQLRAEYPDHEIEVCSTPSLNGAWSNDEQRLDEILEFCAQLWDECPWDWIEEE